MALVVIRVEVIAISLLSAYFIFEHARTKWWRTAPGRQLMFMANVAFIEHILLALVVSRVRVSLWIFVILFSLSAAAWAGWLVLMIRVRTQRDAGTPVEDR